MQVMSHCLPIHWIVSRQISVKDCEKRRSKTNKSWNNFRQNQFETKKLWTSEPNGLLVKDKLSGGHKLFLIKLLSEPLLKGLRHFPSWKFQRWVHFNQRASCSEGSKPLLGILLQNVAKRKPKVFRQHKQCLLGMLFRLKAVVDWNVELIEMLRTGTASAPDSRSNKWLSKRYSP